MNVPQPETTIVVPVGGFPVDGLTMFAHVVTDMLVAGAFILLLFRIVYLNGRKDFSLRVPRSTYLAVFWVGLICTFGATLVSMATPGTHVHLGYKVFVATSIFVVSVLIPRMLPRTVDPYLDERHEAQQAEFREAIKARKSLTAELEQARRGTIAAVAERTQEISQQLLSAEKELSDQRLEIERMAEGKRRLDELIMRTNTAYVHLGMDGRVLECNLALAQILGRANANELVGREMSRLLGHAVPDEVLHFIREVVRCGTFSQEMDIQPPARGHAAIELSGAASVHGHAPCAMVLIRDTSDRRATERKLLENRESLTKALETTREANASRSDFIVKMNHELRAPLNGIIGLSEIIRYKSQGKSMSPVELRKLAQNIHQSGRHLLSMVDDLLDLSRLEAGSREFNPVSTEIRAEVDEALTTLGTIAEKNRISLRNHCPEHFEWMVDRRAFKQIILNLVNNAIKFSPPRSNVDIRLNYTAAAMSLSVKDEGPGIAPDDRDRILMPFGRGKYAEDQNIDGVGLGLTIVSELLKQQGGHIEVETGPRDGSTFIAVFPLTTPARGGTSAA